MTSIYSRKCLLGAVLALTAVLMVSGSAAQAPSQPPDAPKPEVTETHWNLIELEGEAVKAASPESQPYIYLHAQGDKLGGSGGCNRLFGSFDLSGNSLQFHSVASTLMACPGDSMEYEAALADALKLTTSFQISGAILSLRVDERILARFQAAEAKSQ